MKTAIELTATASRKAEAWGLGTRLAGLELDPRAQTGDTVEFPEGAGAVTFVIRARRLRVAADGSQTLVFELDHPPRPARR